jgi:endoglucanase
MKSILPLLLLPFSAVGSYQITEPIHGVSVFGFETEHRSWMCDWTGKPFDWYLQKLQHIGFNSIRLPFSFDFVKSGQWEGMDVVVRAIEKTNMTLLLDFHRIRDSFQSARPWIEGETTMDDFLKTWDIVIQRYENVSNLIGLDIFNEYQLNNAPEWNNIARQTLSYLEKKYGHHKWLYFVQGISWGGNDHDLSFDDLSYSDRIIYTVHKYAFTTQGNYEEDWEWSIANHPANRTNIGELGFISDNPKETAWIVRFFAWLKSKGIKSQYWWCMSPNSWDTGGIFLDNCIDIDCRKVHLLQDFWKG